MARRTGFASLPLHNGKAPAWLFQRMVRLSREITTFIVAEYGAAEMLRRLSDPFWFQAFGCVLGFDWHSSGVTTTVCGAMKEALAGIDHEYGLYVAGGKGARSRQTPAEVAGACERIGRDAAPLVYASRMAAKVDSAAVQDGYQLYHHAFFFTASGDWCVVQQGMSDRTSTARRYHWLSPNISSFVDEPHEAVCCDLRAGGLNLVAHESGSARSACAELAAQSPDVTLQVIERIPELALPARHGLLPGFDVSGRHLHSILLETYQRPPADFEALLAREGVGPKTVRALALASELIFGTPASTRDPARFAFAHGGKDGTPYPVNRRVYDTTIDVLGKAINRAGIDRGEKVRAFRRLSAFTATGENGADAPP